ncbi:hypothetical protein TE101_10875 [Alteromonas macleodii]|nr:hypothetical protein TE101_10875 [Alteromonas macleodii]
MQIVIFTIGVAIYVVAVNLLVKGQEAVNLRFGWPKPKGFINNAACYFSFAIFVFLVLPFAFFFPNMAKRSFTCSTADSNKPSHFNINRWFCSFSYNVVKL